MSTDKRIGIKTNGTARSQSGSRDQATVARESDIAESITNQTVRRTAEPMTTDEESVNPQIDLSAGGHALASSDRNTPLQTVVQTRTDTQPGRVSGSTVIQQCVESELRKYFALLDGQPPHDLYRMVMSQVEKSLLDFVLEECGNNQSRAAEYLGISRGTLRSRINEQQL